MTNTEQPKCVNCGERPYNHGIAGNVRICKRQMYYAPTLDDPNALASRSAVPPADVPAVNQCDGCRRGLPLVRGSHRGEGWDIIGCTAARYADVPAATPTVAVGPNSNGGNIPVPAATPIQTPVVEWCADRERMRRALAAEPESLSIGQLNQAVRDLREDNYQLRLKLQSATPAAVQVESRELCRDNVQHCGCYEVGYAAALRATAASSPTADDGCDYGAIMQRGNACIDAGDTKGAIHHFVHASMIYAEGKHGLAHECNHAKCCAEPYDDRTEKDDLSCQEACANCGADSRHRLRIDEIKWDGQGDARCAECGAKRDATASSVCCPSAEPPTEQEDEAAAEALWIAAEYMGNDEGHAHAWFVIGATHALAYERKHRKPPYLDGSVRGSY